MTRPCFWVLAAALAVQTACERAPNKPNPEDLTIVVEADRSKIETAEKALHERLGQFEQEKERLHKEKEDLMRARSLSQGQDLAQEKKLQELEAKLWAKEKAMWERESSLESERGQIDRQKSDLIGRVGGRLVVGPQDLSAREGTLAQREKGLAQREAEVAKRERDLALRETALAEREATFLRTQAGLAAIRPPVVERSGAAPKINPKKVDQAHKAVLALMRKRGILPGDLPPELAGIGDEIYRARKDGDYPRMADLVEQLSAGVSALAIDAAFVEQKWNRLDRLIKQRPISDKVKEAVAATLPKATRLANDGSFAQANNELNRLFALLNR